VSVDLGEEERKIVAQLELSLAAAACPARYECARLCIGTSGMDVNRP
jgi:hypothetical protein